MHGPQNVKKRETLWLCRLDVDTGVHVLALCNFNCLGQPVKGVGMTKNG